MHVAMTFLKRLMVVGMLLPLVTYAQSNYKPGFVVDLKGNTLNGYIDLKEWGGNPTTIYFKTSANDPTPQKFRASDIGAFEITKVAAFKSYVGPITLDPTNLEKLEHFRDTSTRLDTVFLKVVQTGKNVVLYSYVDYIKKRFFIYDNKTNKLTELIYRIYYVENNVNRVSTVSQNMYKQQLLFVSQQYDSYREALQQELNDAEYDQVDLKAICREINAM